jgi:hypothetical protein
MPPLRRRLRAAAIILYGLASAGTAALAQETTNTLGPPQLKDFSLPGQRTTPPAATPNPPSATPPPAPPARQEPTAEAPLPAERRPAPRPAAPAQRRDSAPSPAPAVTAPGRGAERPVAAEPTTPPAAPKQAAPPAAAPLPAAPQPAGAGWLWPAAGGGVLLLLVAGFLLLRRRRTLAEREQAREEARGELGDALLAAAPSPPDRQPEPEREAEPPAAVEAPTAAPRPWLELDIVPERAAATDSEAIVHYTLTLTNQGGSEARNIRIDPRLFNAGAEGEMAAFLQGPIHEQSGSPHVAIAPGGTLKLNGQVTMPKSELQEIELAGRRIFVPMVAINVAYDWPGGTGRTSRSWLVGREAESPSAKMGPFRLDLGPRIYRSVGRREAKLVRV